MPIPTVQLEPHIAGDTWQGIPVIGPFTINDAPPESPVARVRLTMTRSGGHQSRTFDSADGSIVIVDADTWECSIPPVPFANFTLPPGTYSGQLEFTDEDGVRLTTHNVVLTILLDKTP